MESDVSRLVLFKDDVYLSFRALGVPNWQCRFLPTLVHSRSEWTTMVGRRLLRSLVPPNDSLSCPTYILQTAQKSGPEFGKKFLGIQLFH